MCLLSMKLNDFDHKATRWLSILIYMYNYDFHMGFHLMVMLRTTTGSYGLPIIKVAYGEILFYSIEAVWEIIAQEKWLGCQHDASSMFDILGSIPVWAAYILFFDFHNIKTYIYCFKIYM